MAAIQINYVCHELCDALSALSFGVLRSLYIPSKGPASTDNEGLAVSEDMYESALCRIRDIGVRAAILLFNWRSSSSAKFHLAFEYFTNR